MAATLVAFFGLTFALAWVLWLIAAAATASAELSLGVRSLFFLPGTFIPGIVAVALTARADGRPAVAALLGRTLQWQVPARWYLFAIGYMAAAKLAAALAYRLITGAWPAFGTLPLYLMAAAVAFSTPFQAGEEVGWRGYALPRLGARLGLGPAGIVLGVIWALWHLPLFFIHGTDSAGQPFLIFLLSVTALSVAMTWLYSHTHGSLLLLMLMHAAINNTTGIVPAALPGPVHPFALSASLLAWLTFAFLLIGALYCFVRMPSRSPLTYATRVQTLS